MSSAGVLTIDAPSLSSFYDGKDVPLPDSVRGHVQLRQYFPKGPHPPFQLFNVYFKSGDFSFNKSLIDVMVNCPNDFHTFVCGDFNFIEKASDSSSPSPSLPPSSFLESSSNFKAHFKVFDPPHDSHTFFHAVSGAPSPYSWSSRIDRFLLPLCLFDNPLVTPVVSIPSHCTNVNPVHSSSSFSDHLPIHVSYGNGFVCSRGSKSVPSWLALSPVFAENVRKLWKGPVKGAYRSFLKFKNVLYEAASLTRKSSLSSNSLSLFFSQRLSLLRLVCSPVQDLSSINDLLSRSPPLRSLVSFIDGRWIDSGLLDSIRDPHPPGLSSRSPSSPSPPTYVNVVKDLASKAPSGRSRVGGLRLDPDSPEAISDEDRSKVAASFWSKIWSARNPRPPLSELKSFLSHYNKKVNSSLCPFPSLDDVRFSIENSSDSTAGPDGISFAAWRAVPDLAAPVLFGVLSAMTSGQPPPKDFNVGLLFLLPKKHTGLVSDTRPISVTNTDNRILAAAVARAIMPAVIDFIDPSQKGFLSGVQGTDHVVDVNSFFYEGVENNLERFLFFLDTAKAFDSIDHTWISLILDHLCFPSWFRFFVRGCLKNVRVSPFFGSNTNIWIHIERGVKQGWSPLPSLVYYCI